MVFKFYLFIVNCLLKEIFFYKLIKRNGCYNEMIDYFSFLGV